MQYPRDENAVRCASMFTCRCHNTVSHHISLTYMLTRTQVSEAIFFFSFSNSHLQCCFALLTYIYLMCVCNSRPSLSCWFSCRYNGPNVFFSLSKQRDKFSWGQNSSLGNSFLANWSPPSLVSIAMYYIGDYALGTAGQSVAEDV